MSGYDKWDDDIRGQSGEWRLPRLHGACFDVAAIAATAIVVVALIVLWWWVGGRTIRGAMFGVVWVLGLWVIVGRQVDRDLQRMRGDHR